MIKLKLFIALSIIGSFAGAQNTSYHDSVFTEYFKRQKGWISSDATISVPLPDGKVVWMFGDTHLDNLNPADTTVPCLFQVRNSMMVQDAEDPDEFITILDNTKTGVNRTPVKLKDNDTSLFWPGDGFVRGDTLITFWIRYNATTLAQQGIYAVKIHWPDFTDASSITSIQKVPIEGASAGQFEFGNAVIPDTASNYLYVYGHRKNWIVLEPYLARCPLNDVMGTWEFYTGSGWSTDLGKAKKISDHYVSPSFDVVKINGRYYIITQENGYLTCGLGRQIFAYSADSPYGQFGNIQTIWVINDKYKESYLITYNTTAHPEFNEDGELLLSYNVNGICPGECLNAWTDRMNADTYRPKFVRVPFSVLDTGYRFEPQAVIEASETEGIPPFSVHFSARSSLTDGTKINYLWEFGDGTPSSTLKEPIHTYDSAGVFEVKLKVTDQTNKSDTATIIIASGITGVHFTEVYEENICVYPNPANKSFVVEIPDFKPEIPAHITIVNAEGKEVMKEQVVNRTTTFDTMKTGMFFILVEAAGLHTVKKIMIHD